MIITIDDGEVRRALEQLKETIPEAGKAASRASLKEFAEKLRDRVREMIPDKGGWYDIYRESIQLVEINPDHYDLTTTIYEVSFSRIEADKSFVWLSGGDEVARVLGQYNPWTLDTLPAVKDGFNSDLIVKPASEGEVEICRRKHYSNRAATAQLLDRLKTPAYPLDSGHLPKINGRVLADVPFLARRLEHGLGGFPRTPIWSRIDAEGQIISKDKAIEKAGDAAFNAKWRRPKK